MRRPNLSATLQQNMTSARTFYCRVAKCFGLHFPTCKKFSSDFKHAEVHKHHICIPQKKLGVLNVLKVIDHLLVVVCRCDQLPHTVALTLPQLSAQVSHVLSTYFQFKLFVSEVTLSKIYLILQVAVFKSVAYLK